MRALLYVVLMLVVSGVLAKKGKHSRRSGSRRRSCRGSRHCDDDDDDDDRVSPEWGPPGLNGFPGQPGLDGLPGRHGYPGPPGYFGSSGPPGSPGIEGPPGQLLPGARPPPKGQQGRDGNVGARGVPGLTGVPGESGHKGDQGDQGMPGRQGRGVEGVKGDPGMPGEYGRQGEPGSCSCDGPDVNPPVKQYPVAFCGLIRGFVRPARDELVTLTFDELTLNIGEGIQSNAAQFTAPVRGLYMFHVVSIGNGNSAAPFVLYHNITAVMTSGRGDDDAMGMYPMGANDVILQIDAGDDVTLQAKPRPGGLLSGVIGIMSSPSDVTFSGFLLRRLPDTAVVPPIESE